MSALYQQTGGRVSSAIKAAVFFGMGVVIMLRSSEGFQ